MDNLTPLSGTDGAGSAQLPVTACIKATSRVLAMIEAALLESIHARNDECPFAKWHGATPEWFTVAEVLPLGRGDVVLLGEEPSYYLANVGLGESPKDRVLAAGTCFLVRSLRCGEVVDGRSILHVDEAPCPYKEGGKAWKRWQAEAEAIRSKPSESLHIVCFGHDAEAFGGTDETRTMGRVCFRNERGLIDGLRLNRKALAVGA